jgi:hypothetical protein
MYKKSILSIAIASSLMLTGCLDDNKPSEENVGSITNPPSEEQKAEFAEKAGKTWPVFSPATSELPIPNDLIFDSTAKDGTFQVTDSSPPVTTALNELSGASTVAPIDIKISGEINPATLTGNVFLIALDYASGSPVQGLSIQEPPTVPPGSQPSVALEHLVLDGFSYIRINPTTPLNPLTRYIVVVTDGVQDSTGDPLIRHPGAAAYEALSDEDRGLASGALAPIKALINNLWEAVAVKYFALAVNPVRAGFSLPPYDESNIVLSYSFTTSGDEKVLNYIADPAQWFADQITTFVGVSTATSIVTNKTDLNSDTVVDYTDVSLAVTGALAAFPANPSDPADTTISDALAPIAAAFPHPAIGCGSITAGPDYINCVAKVLVTFPTTSGGFSNLLPTPASTTVTFDEAGALDINLVSSLTGSLGIPAGLVSVVQGEMTIPYYAGVPAGANGAPLITDSWVADDTLATAINSAFAPLGLQIPQADPLVSTAINYIFPFPKKKDDVTIPVLGIHPTNPAGTMKSVIYQHGITTDRSAALAFGASMVAGAKGNGFDVGVIAIDQPLHGIDGISPAQQATLAETLLSTPPAVLSSPDGTFDGEDADEQATIDSVVDGSFVIGALLQIQGGGCPLGITDPSDSGQIAAAIATVESEVPCGSSPAASLKSAQTLVRTVAFGASIIPGLAQGSDSERHFGFTSAGAGVAPNAMDYTGSSTTNASGSLFINLTSFLTSRDNNRQQVLDLLTVRKSLSGIDMNGATANGDLDGDDVYFIGHSLGTINGLPFVAVANDSSTPTDDIVAANMQTPGAGITRLLENSPTFSTPILGGLAALGLTQDTSSFQAYMNILQGALDSIDPANFAADLGASKLNTPLLITIVVGDTTIPNSVDSAGEVLGDGSIAYMSGNEPVGTLSGAGTLSASDFGAPVPLGQRVVRFYSESGAVNHGTPLFPSTGVASQLAFAEMVAQGTSMVLSGGAAVSVANASVIE